MTAERRLRLEVRAEAMRAKKAAGAKAASARSLALAVELQLLYWRRLLASVDRHIALLESMVPVPQAKRPAA